METAGNEEKGSLQGSGNKSLIGFVSSPVLPQQLMKRAQVVGRILAIVLTLASISVMVTSTQTVVLFGVNVVARYSYCSAFKYLVGVNIVVCAFSVLSLMFVWITGRHPSGGSKANNLFFIFLHDMMMMLLMMSGCAAAMAVGDLGRHGQQQVGWAPVCKAVEQFCNRALISMILSFLVFFSYFALTTIAARNLMSQPS